MRSSIVCISVALLSQLNIAFSLTRVLSDEQEQVTKFAIFFKWIDHVSVSSVDILPDLIIPLPSTSNLSLYIGEFSNNLQQKLL